MALSDAQIKAMGFGLPVGTDLIRNGDNEISKNARAAAEGIVDARWKKNIIPMGAGDLREYLYGAGKEGQYAALNGAVTASLTGLPDELADNPIQFTAVVETLQSGVVITLTPYDVWDVSRYVCTSAPSSGDGWTRWRKVVFTEDLPDSEGEAGTPVSASGFKTLPLILTAGRGGNENKAPLSATVEYDVNLAASIYTPRFRFAIRDGNPRWGTSTAQTIQLSNISVGGVAKLSSMSTNADGSITFSPWMDGKLGNLKFDYVAQQQPRYIIGGGRVNGARRTEMPFELWLEVEVPASTPAIGLIGDSNSVGNNTTIPIHDSWLQIYCRRMGFFPVQYGHSGDNMSSSQDPNHYKWNRWNHLDKPDMVVHANGANDIPSTSEGGVTLAQLQERVRGEIAVAEAKISKNHQFITLRSRSSGINNTIRVQYNNWIKTLPEGIRDWQDLASPVTAGDTGGPLPQYISSDGIHLNTAGQTAIANSGLKVMTTRSSLVFDESAGRTVKAWDYLNQREQLIYGDTGARDITSLFTGIVGGSVIIRRTAQSVEVDFQDVILPNGSPITFVYLGAAIPTGFRPPRSKDFNIPARTFAESSTIGSARFNDSGNVHIYRYTDGEFIRVSAVWMTNEPWPTSLPGVAA